MVILLCRPIDRLKGQNPSVQPRSIFVRLLNDEALVSGEARRRSPSGRRFPAHWKRCRLGDGADAASHRDRDPGHSRRRCTRRSGPSSASGWRPSWSPPRRRGAPVSSTCFAGASAGACRCRSALLVVVWHASFDASISELSHAIIPGSDAAKILLFTGVVVLAAMAVIVATRGPVRRSGDLAAR